MKRYLIVCFLWVFYIHLWGQTDGGYGGNFNPESPDNPSFPSVTITKKYTLNLIAGRGGNVNISPNSQYEAGEKIYLNASTNAGYKFRCWMEGDSIISSSSWHYYIMPERNVEIKAIFTYEPESPANPEKIPLLYYVTAEAVPSHAGNVSYNHNKIYEGDYTYVNAYANIGYKFIGWYIGDSLVSLSSNYNFKMENHHMHFVAQFEFAPEEPGNPNNNLDNPKTYVLKYLIDGEVCHIEYLPVGATITAIEIPEKRGHSFSGWQDLPTIMPNHDLVINGTFSPNKYHVTYMIEEKIVSEEDVIYDTPLTPPTNLNKEGHTLNWKNLPPVMPDSDVIVEGFYTPNVYKLTYIVDGNVYKNLDVTYGTTITPEGIPTKSGHTFSGWSEIPDLMPAKDVIVVGTFTPNSYEVTFLIDGQVYKKDTLLYGSIIAAPEVPAKEGYTFSGWSDYPTTVPAKDLLITGSYCINYYVVTFIANGVVVKTDTLNFGSLIKIPEPPFIEGHTFNGWDNLPETMPAKDIIVCALLEVNNYKLVIETVSNKGRFVGMRSEISVPFGTDLTTLKIETDTSLIFEGWKEIPPTMPSENIFVEGILNYNEYNLKLKVEDEIKDSISVICGSSLFLSEDSISRWSLNLDYPGDTIYIQYESTDGIQSSPLQIASAIEIIKINYQKEGHTFSGWNGLSETMPAKDVEVSGTFTVNKYKLTGVVELDGKVIFTMSDSVIYGTKIPLPQVPELPGYTFGGWNGVPTTMPAHDLTITASFAVNRYKLTYKVDGKEYFTDSVAYKTTLTPIEVPTKEGHTFSGWSEVPETMPNHDVTICGTFTVNKYLVTYKVGEEIIASDSIEYGATVLPPEAPEKEGYTFIGWNDVPETMPARDIVILGFYEETAVKLGDVNGDGAINVSDVSAIVGMLIKFDAPPYEKSADVNSDGIINVSDVSAIVGMLLSDNQSKKLEAPAAPASMTTYNEVASSVFIEPFQINPGEEKEILVNLNNPDLGVISFQFDLTLPEGLEIAYEEEDGEKYFFVDKGSRLPRSYQVESTQFTDGKYRILAYSNKNDLVRGTSGDIVTITVKAAETMPDGIYTINFVETVLTKEVDGESVSVYPENTSCVVSVGNATGIEGVDAVAARQTIYDLQGRPTDAKKRGIYIINGKKVMK